MAAHGRGLLLLNYPKWVGSRREQIGQSLGKQQSQIQPRGNWELSSNREALPFSFPLEDRKNNPSSPTTRIWLSLCFLRRRKKRLPPAPTDPCGGSFPQLLSLPLSPIQETCRGKPRSLVWLAFRSPHRPLFLFPFCSCVLLVPRPLQERALVRALPAGGSPRDRRRKPSQPPPPPFPGAQKRLRALPVARRFGCSKTKTLGPVYGNSGVPSRRQRVSLPPPSHAFPRHLRRPHPGDHGGDGAEVQVRVPPRQSGAAERARSGKRSPGRESELSREGFRGGGGEETESSSPAAPRISQGRCRRGKRSPTNENTIVGKLIYERERELLAFCIKKTNIIV